ncbi:HET-domain-containing protein [Thozetella sp. PMI_491]|nr:HET-domain-containing protein [Thozetella sp. PMI_491]
MAGTNDDPFLEGIAQCTFCLDFDASFLRRQWRRFGRLPAVEVPYGFTLAKLQENIARNGCKGCGLLMKAAEHITHEFSIDFRNAFFEYIDKGGIQGLSFTLALLHPVHASDSVLERAHSERDLKIRRVTGPSEDDPSRKTEHRVSSPDYELFAILGQEHPRAPAHASIVGRASRCGDTGSNAAVQWAMAQIQHCRTTHPLCEVEHPNWTLPTRVLDLGDDLSQLTADPKLHETHDEQAHYACLSHCWGRSLPVETTISTLEGFKQRISWQLLPKTFQDAIVFTRKLGIRYLWIDSLCIIQDDAQDWFAEASRMASVYEHAQVTLMAAASTDSSGGLFRQARPEACLSQEEGIWLRQLPSPAFFEQPGKSPSASEDIAPLLTRAWVFQERLLSRRVIYFTPLELVLECRVATATESGHNWIDASVKHTFSAIYRMTAEGDEPTSTMWRSLVQLFTHLGLTKVADTLPAMAGLAKRIVNKDIPTWSWARTDAGKSFISIPNMLPLCEVVEAGCSSSLGEENLFVHVDGGCILVSGFLIAAKETGPGVEVDHVPRVRHVVKRDYDWQDPPEPEPAITSGKLFFLPIGASVGDDDISITALALREDQDKDGCEAYRRVGVATMKMLYLQPYNYILEDETALVFHLKNQIELAESILEDERYKPESTSGPLWLRKDSSALAIQLRHAAYFEHLDRYGGGDHPEVPFEEFCGRPHLDSMKKQLREEQMRILEWKRRNDEGEEQVYQKRAIKII